MKVNELFESAEAKNVKAVRAMKFSLRDGKNDLGVNLDNSKFEFYSLSWAGTIYVGKKGELKEGDEVNFENADKPGFAAYGNYKLSSRGSLTVRKVISSFKEALAIMKAERNPVLIINPSIANTAEKPVAVEKNDDPQTIEDSFFVLGYWGDPYRAGNKEYFWAGGYTTRKAAKAFGDRKLKNGQPSTFHDWSGGKCTIFRGQDKFLAAAKKAGIEPNLSNLDWKE